MWIGVNFQKATRFMAKRKFPSSANLCAPVIPGRQKCEVRIQKLILHSSFCLLPSLLLWRRAKRADLASSHFDFAMRAGNPDLLRSRLGGLPIHRAGHGLAHFGEPPVRARNSPFVFYGGNF